MSDQPVPEVSPAAGDSAPSRSSPGAKFFQRRTDLVFAALGLLVAVMACVVSIFVPEIRAVFFPPPTLTPTIFPTAPAPSLSQARVEFVVTWKGTEQILHSGDKLFINAGDTLLIETRVLYKDLPYPRDLTIQYSSTRKGDLPGKVISYTRDQAGTDMIVVTIIEQQTQERLDPYIKIEAK